MATSPAAVQLPIFYKSLMPLNAQAHASHGMVRRTGFPFARTAHAIPLTVDEFAIAHRHFPIVFGTGSIPTPLALTGLVEGQNLFIDSADEWRADSYVPAYVRRYPFMLAKLTPQSEQLSLVFDDTCPQIVAGEGEPLFAGVDPSEATRNVLNFCEQFEQSVARTRQVVEEIQKLDLFMDAEVSIQRPDMPQPAVFRGFKMVSEEKLREIRGDQARKLVQNGVLGLIYAHMLSMSLIGELHARASRNESDAAAA